MYDCSQVILLTGFMFVFSIHELSYQSTSVKACPDQCNSLSDSSNQSISGSFGSLKLSKLFCKSVSCWLRSLLTSPASVYSCDRSSNMERATDKAYLTISSALSCALAITSLASCKDNLVILSAASFRTSTARSISL